MTRCAVCGGTYSQKKPEISFHRVPKAMLRQWEGSTGMQLSEQDRICSLHFREEDTHVVGAKRYLKQSAVPLLLLESQDEESMVIENVRGYRSLNTASTNQFNVFTHNDEGSIVIDDVDISDVESVSSTRASSPTGNKVVRLSEDDDKTSLDDPKVAEQSLRMLKKSLAINQKKLKIYQVKCRNLSGKIQSLNQTIQKLNVKLYLLDSQQTMLDVS